MKELKDNEKRMYDQLVKLAEKENPIRISLRNLKVNIRKKEWFFRWKYRLVSHMSARDLLMRLQEKGYITLDYSEHDNPKIIINRMGGVK